MNSHISCVAAATLAAISISCGFHPFETEVEVAIPPVPPGASECVDDRVILKVDSEESGGIDISARAGEVRRLKLPKAQVTVFTAFYQGGVPPAGGVLPWDGDGEARVELGFGQGFCSTVFSRLAEAGVPLSVVNYRRLSRECRLRSGGNPYLLDNERIFRALLAGNFSVRDIVMLREYELPPEALPPGEWNPANPLAEKLTGGEAARVHEGRWTFYTREDSAVLWCDSMGWHFYARDGSFSRGGTW